MGRIKSMIENVCYFWKDGLSISEISNLYKISIDEVRYILDTYYKLMLEEEP